MQTRRHVHTPKEESTRKFVAQKPTSASVDRERRDGCAKLSEPVERWTSLALLSRWTDNDRNGVKQSGGKLQRDTL